jgi:uncharacterized membrane protein
VNNPAPIFCDESRTDTFGHTRGHTVPELIIAAILIGVFVLFAGIFLLGYALFQVSKMHSALAEAGQRIQQLESTVTKIVTGETPAGRLAAPDTPVLVESPSAAAAPQASREPAAAQPEPAAAASAAPPPPAPPPRAKPAPPAVEEVDAQGVDEWPWGGIAAAGAALLVLLLGANQVVNAVATATVGFGIGAGLMAAGFSRYAGGRRFAAPMGATVLAIAIAVATGPLDVLDAATGFLALSVTCLAAAGLSAWSGRALAGVAAVLGAATPLLIPVGAAAGPETLSALGGHAGAAARYGHLVALTATLLLAAGFRPALSGWALASVGAALAWGVVDAIQGAPMATVYLSALGVLGLCLLWDETNAPGPLTTLWGRLQASKEATKVGAALTVAAGILLAVTVWRAAAAAGVQAAAGLLILAVLGHAVSAVRPGYGGYALILTGVSALAILVWPRGMGLGEAGLSENQAVLAAAGVLAILGVASGWREARSSGREGNAIAFGSLAPLLAIGAAAVRLQGAEALWLAGGALAVAASSALMAQGFGGQAQSGQAQSAQAQSGQAQNGSGAAAARTTGMAIAGAATALAVAAAAPAEWLTVALAALAPALIWIDKQRGGAALTGAAVLVAAAALARLLWPWAAAAGPLGETPLFNMLLPIYGASAMFFYFGARLLADARWRSAPLAKQCLLAATWGTGAAFLSMQVRHAFSGAAMITPVESLAELGLHATIWIGLALALRVSDRTEPMQPFQLTEGFALAAGIAFSLVGAGFVLNPWWGVLPASAPTIPVFNDLMAGFALPAAALALYAMACASEKQTLRARWISGGAGLLVFIQVILELRRGFAGAAMNTAAQGDVERWIYTGATMAGAAALLIVGMERKSTLLRSGSLALVLAALAKALVFDLSAVEGGMRALAALAILATGAVVWRFYQTKVFNRSVAAQPIGPNAKAAPRQ